MPDDDADDEDEKAGDTAQIKSANDDVTFPTDTALNKAGTVTLEDHDATQAVPVPQNNSSIGDTATKEAVRINDANEDIEVGTRDGGTEVSPTSNENQDAARADSVPSGGPSNVDDAECEIEVPKDLHLQYFLGRKELSDCSVKLTQEMGDVVEEVPCHRVVLAGGSSFFYREFVGCGRTSVELPPLPSDQLRRQVDVPRVFPLALRYLYAGQQWEAVADAINKDNITGLLAVSLILEMRRLSEHVLQHLDPATLSPSLAARLLHMQCGLQGVIVEECSGLRERCVDVL